MSGFNSERKTPCRGLQVNGGGKTPGERLPVERVLMADDLVEGQWQSSGNPDGESRNAKSLVGVSSVKGKPVEGFRIENGRSPRGGNSDETIVEFL